MKVPMDINTYKASFTGATKQYNFYVNMIFPGWSNAMKAGAQGLLGDGIDSLMKFDTLATAATLGASTAVGILNTKGGVDGIEFLVKATQLPESNFEEVTSSWMGHDYKMSGKQSFTDWTVTFNIDKNGLLLRKFWEWQRIMHDPESNTYGNPVSYMTDPEVHLLGYDTGETICCYKMYGAWPKTIGSVQLDYSANEIATVDITFAYQYHTVSESEPGALSKFLSKGVRSFFQMGGMGGVDNIINGEMVSKATSEMLPKNTPA